MPPPRPPFDIVRAVVWIIAVVIGFTMVILAGAASLCGYMVVVRGMTFDECKTLDLRGIWQEILTTLLVLLNTRNTGGPPAPPRPPTEKEK